jgi:hypothetical protein
MKVEKSFYLFDQHLLPRMEECHKPSQMHSPISPFSHPLHGDFEFAYKQF